MPRVLEIEETLEGGLHTLVLSGRLDANTAHQLDAVACRIYAADEAADVLLDLGRCTFVSSAGIRVIVALQKRSTMGGSLRVRNVRPEVMDVLKSTGIDKVLAFV